MITLDAKEREGGGGEGREQDASHKREEGGRKKGDSAQRFPGRGRNPLPPEIPLFFLKRLDSGSHLSRGPPWAEDRNIRNL